MRARGESFPVPGHPRSPSVCRHGEHTHERCRVGLTCAMCESGGLGLGPPCDAEASAGAVGTYTSVGCKSAPRPFALLKQPLSQGTHPWPPLRGKGWPACAAVELLLLAIAANQLTLIVASYVGERNHCVYRLSAVYTLQPLRGHSWASALPAKGGHASKPCSRTRHCASRSLTRSRRAPPGTRGPVTRSSRAAGPEGGSKPLCAESSTGCCFAGGGRRSGGCCSNSREQIFGSACAV